MKIIQIYIMPSFRLTEKKAAVLIVVRARSVSQSLHGAMQPVSKIFIYQLHVPLLDALFCGFLQSPDREMIFLFLRESYWFHEKKDTEACLRKVPWRIKQKECPKESPSC
jgi:hypothetical protein